MANDDENRWRDFGAYLKQVSREQFNSRAEHAKAADVHPSLLQTFEEGGKRNKGRWDLPPVGSSKVYAIIAAIDGWPIELAQRLADLLGQDVETIEERIYAAGSRLPVHAGVAALPLERRMVSIESTLTRLADAVEQLTQDLRRRDSDAPPPP